jgi:hypothetical protein
MQTKTIAQLQLDVLQHIYSVLINSIDPINDPDAFEYLAGIRDQASRIMREAIEAEETL